MFRSMLTLVSLVFNQFFRIEEPGTIVINRPRTVHKPKGRLTHSSATFGNGVLFFETRSQLFEIHGDPCVCVWWGCS